ncbi:hypothetical protein WICPIJ_006027, partial [Wickerhamomyces pijperi]
EIEADGEPEQEIEADGEPQQEIEADGEPEQEIEADGEPEQEIDADGEPEQEIDADGEPEQEQEHEHEQEQEGLNQDERQNQARGEGGEQEGGIFRELYKWARKFAHDRPFAAALASIHLIDIITSLCLFIAPLARHTYGAPIVKAIKYLADYSFIILRMVPSFRRRFRVGFVQFFLLSLVRILSSCLVPLLDFAEKFQHHFRSVKLTSTVDLSELQLLTTTKLVNQVSIGLCVISVVILLILLVANCRTQIPPNAQGQENNAQNAADVEAGNAIPMENIEQNPNEDEERGPAPIVVPNPLREAIMAERYNLSTKLVTRVLDLGLLITYLLTAGELSVDNPQPFWLIAVALSLSFVGSMISLIIFLVFLGNEYCTFE